MATRNVTVTIMAPVTVEIDVEFDETLDADDAFFDFRVIAVHRWNCNDITVGDVDAALSNDSDLCDDLIERLARGE